MMAAYLAVIAWTQNLDCVALDQNEIVGLWGLRKRVENQRLDWLKHDVKLCFPHVEALWYRRGTRKFGSVFLARREFPTDAFTDSMSDEKRIQLLTDKGLQSAVVTLPAESEMLAYLTSVIHGLADLPVAADR
jgi:hypothetical protein